MKLYIQNMVCLCCKKTVAAELQKMKLAYTNLKLGEVTLTKRISMKEKEQLRHALQESDLELMDDKKAILVEKIIAIIINMIRNPDELRAENFSVYLTRKLHHEYHTLSSLFSKTKGITIEHFIILNKIERVKELLIYNELNLSEISHKLNYSSVAHLSNQFKKVTGLTPSFFKTMENQNRIGFDCTTE